MVFQYPGHFIYLAIVLIFALLFVYGFIMKQRMLRRFGVPAAVRVITSPASPMLQWIKAGLLIFAAFVLVVALARPKWGHAAETVTEEGIDIIFALDASMSMLAEDIQPSRLERAKFEIATFTENLGGDRVGLVLFAGSSYTACPLTHDYEAFTSFVNVVEPSLMNTPGTRIGDAVRVAIQSFVNESRSRVLVLITDGEDHGSYPAAAAREAARSGVRIFTVGIGSSSGVPLPIRDGYGVNNYKKDRAGRTIISRLDESLLKKMAEVTGGSYIRSSSGSIGLAEVHAAIAGMDRRIFGSAKMSRYAERFQLFILIALILLSLELLVPEKRIFRPGIIADMLRPKPRPSVPAGM